MPGDARIDPVNLASSATSDSVLATTVVAINFWPLALPSGSPRQRSENGYHQQQCWRPSSSEGLQNHN
jgi:hypothetical protein